MGTLPAVATQLELVAPRGFCAGVDRAIEIVERALETLGAPIYVRHEIVHNRTSSTTSAAKGAVFVEELAEVPAGATVIFCAHGVSPAVRGEAAARAASGVRRDLPARHQGAPRGRAATPRGRDHAADRPRRPPEVEGTMGRGRPTRIDWSRTSRTWSALAVADPENVASPRRRRSRSTTPAAIIDGLKRRFPAIRGPEQRRHLLRDAEPPGRGARCSRRASTWCWWSAARTAPTPTACASSARARGAAPHLIDARRVEPAWIAGRRRVGVTAGASAPEVLVQEVGTALTGAGFLARRRAGAVSRGRPLPLPRGARQTS